MENRQFLSDAAKLWHIVFILCIVKLTFTAKTRKNFDRSDGKTRTCHCSVTRPLRIGVIFLSTEAQGSALAVGTSQP